LSNRKIKSTPHALQYSSNYKVRESPEKRVDDRVEEEYFGLLMPIRKKSDELEKEVSQKSISRKNVVV
jgi:hypothetical protein